MHPWMMAQQEQKRITSFFTAQKRPRIALDEEDQTNEVDHSDIEDAAAVSESRCSPCESYGRRF